MPASTPACLRAAVARPGFRGLSCSVWRARSGFGGEFACASLARRVPARLPTTTLPALPPTCQRESKGVLSFLPCHPTCTKSVLKTFLHDHLPEDAHERCSDRAYVSGYSWQPPSSRPASAGEPLTARLNVKHHPLLRAYHLPTDRWQSPRSRPSPAPCSSHASMTARTSFRCR